MTPTITPLLTPPKRERLPDTIAAQLRALIVSKKIKVGDKLPTERELTESLYVSRVVVKQALRRRICVRFFRSARHKAGLWCTAARAEALDPLDSTPYSL